MGNNQTALFIMWPKHIDELKRPHLIQEERAYKIIATIELNKIDFGNFIYGMAVERIYLENNAHLCSIGEIFRCIKSTVYKGLHRVGI